MAVKSQHETVQVLQFYESLRLVVNEALGGKSSEQTTPTQKPVETYAELVAAFSMVGGQIGG